MIEIGIVEPEEAGKMIINRVSVLTNRQYFQVSEFRSENASYFLTTEKNTYRGSTTSLWPDINISWTYSMHNNQTWTVIRINRCHYTRPNKVALWHTEQNSIVLNFQPTRLIWKHFSPSYRQSFTLDVESSLLENRDTRVGSKISSQITATIITVHVHNNERNSES